MLTFNPLNIFVLLFLIAVTALPYVVNAWHDRRERRARHSRKVRDLIK